MMRSLALFVALVALTWTGPALACKCMLPPVETAREDATAVFEGRVVSIESLPGSEATNGERRVTLRVVRTWKGLERDERVVVFTNGSSAACGYSFAQDTSYLVYARISQDQKLHVNSCSRTRVIVDADRDLAFLGAGSTPVNIEKSGPHGIDGGITSVASVDAGDLPPPVLEAQTPAVTAVKKKGCALAEPAASSHPDVLWLAAPAALLFARRRRRLSP